MCTPVQFQRSSHCICYNATFPKLKPKALKIKVQRTTPTHNTRSMQYNSRILPTNYEHRSASKIAQAACSYAGGREVWWEWKITCGTKRQERAWDRSKPPRRRSSWISAALPPEPAAGEGRRRVFGFGGEGRGAEDWFLTSSKGPGWHLQNSCIRDCCWALFHNKVSSAPLFWKTKVEWHTCDRH